MGNWNESPCISIYLIYSSSLCMPTLMFVNFSFPWIERAKERPRLAYFNHYVKVDFSFGKCSNVFVSCKNCVSSCWIFFFSKHGKKCAHNYVEGRAQIVHKITRCTRFSWMHNQVFYFIRPQIGTNALEKVNCWKKLRFDRRESKFKWIAMNVIVFTLKCVVHRCIEFDVWSECVDEIKGNWSLGKLKLKYSMDCKCVHFS